MPKESEKAEPEAAVKTAIQVVFFLKIQYDKEDGQRWCTRGNAKKQGKSQKDGRRTKFRFRKDGLPGNRGGRHMNVCRPKELLEQQVTIAVPMYEKDRMPAWAEELAGTERTEELNLEYGKEYHILAGSKAQIVLLGMGKKEEITRRKLREAAQRAARSLKDRPLYLAAEAAACREITAEEAVYEMAYGAVYGRYEFVKVNAQAKQEQEIGIAGEEEGTGRTADEAAQAASCVNRARNLGNMPSNYMTPEVLAEEAEKLARELGVSCEILTNEELGKLGAGALLGVNRGSSHGARMITLRYQGNGDAPYTALVGKGLTFDAGGYTLKTPAGMRGMKYDMLSLIHI